MEPRSLYELYRTVTETLPDKTAFRFRRSGRWTDLTWSAHRDAVERIARGLVALGLRKGDRVGILAQTRLEWVQADTAVVTAGGVTVGVYPSSTTADCAFILEHSDSEILFVEDAAQLEKIRAVRSTLPRLRKVILFEGPGDESEGVLSWEAFVELGRAVPPARLRELGEALGPDDLATLIYTSGTTGTPKGVMITHGNLLFSTWSAGECLPVAPHHVTLFFLPLAHVFARLVIWLGLRKAFIVAFAEDIKRVPEELREVRPHFFAGVPRIFEKFQERVEAGAEQGGAVRRTLARWALGVGREASRRVQAGERLPLHLRVQRALASALVLRRIRAALGGRLLYAISGAAPLDRATAEFFDACGLPLLEGIGMTENTSFSNVNRLERNRLGTVGPVGPGIEMRLAPDGEVLFRGPNVMRGYFKNPEATREAIDAEGWLHSGDVGEIDAEGYLKITDRKKELIITAGGKNVAPQRVERVLRGSRYIGQAVAYGDRRKYITALVTLDAHNIGEWARANGLGSASLDELTRHPWVHELIDREIDERNGLLASFETVKRFRILPRELTVEGGELTPTLKIKRRVVYDTYRDLLDEMYSGLSPDHETEIPRSRS